MSALNILLASAAATLAPAAAAGEAAPPLPEAVRAVIDQATASGDAPAVEAVVRHAIAAHPQAEDEIRRLHREFLAGRAERQAQEEAERQQRLARASMLELWDGAVELGGSRFTGSTSSFGLFGALNARRQGLDWAHRLSARAEIQETDGRRTAERLSAEWQPRRRLGERVYAFGISQFERDPFVGIAARYSAGLGAGYSLVDKARIRIEVEAGGAVRSSDLLESGDRTTLAGRGSIDVEWKLTDRLELKQAGSLFIDADHESGSATSALDATLFGPVRLRLSYEIRFEKDVLRQLDATRTSSRATLVYDF